MYNSIDNTFQANFLLFGRASAVKKRAKIAWGDELVIRPLHNSVFLRVFHYVYYLFVTKSRLGKRRFPQIAFLK